MPTADPDQADRLLEHPAVAEARRRIFDEDEETLEEQVRITEIPAPPFGEEARGRMVLRRFHDLDLEDAHRDRVGNVLADLPGREPGPPAILLSAHLDTVFSAGTDVRVRRVGDRWVGPGISDDGRGLAAMLAVARVLRRGEVPLRRGVRFVATVGEEGAGDLRGAKEIFTDGGEGRTADGFVSLDGAGLGRIVTRGLGVRRLRLTVQGPGGHSWIDRTAPNPIHALAHTVAEMDRLALPLDPPVGLTVARWDGGSSINAVPREAWVEIDLRSESGNHLRDTEQQVRRIAAGALGSANAAPNRTGPALELEVEVIGDRPPGATDPDHPLVQAAVDATRTVGEVPELVASSTDSNIPMALGIPAITMGAGGEAGKAHTPEEWYSNEKGPEGVLRALLTVLLFAGVDGL